MIMQERNNKGDIQKRLGDCKQVTYILGKRRIKFVEEQHADFTRLEQEFGVDDQIPANLPNTASHNTPCDIQQELRYFKYGLANRGALRYGRKQCASEGTYTIPCAETTRSTCKGGTSCEEITLCSLDPT